VAAAEEEAFFLTGKVAAPAEQQTLAATAAMAAC